MNSKFNVQDLLNGNIDEKYNDKVFWYASEVVVKNNQVDIYVKNDNLVTFDKIDLKIKKISDFTGSTQSDLNHMRDVLISSGSFLFINDKLVVTQRELKAEYDPGFWTTPAGRCDRTIFDTGIKETIEEIEIKREDKILFPDYAKKFIAKIENIEFYKLNSNSNMLISKIFKVNMYLDNILIEQSKLWMLYSEKVNTLEFRIPIFYKTDEKNLKIRNPEYLKAKTELKTIYDLEKVQTVPALNYFLKEIKEKR